MGQRRGTAALPSGKQPSLRTYAIKGPILGLVLAVKRQTYRRVANLNPISILWLRSTLIQLKNLVLREKVLEEAVLLFEVDGT
jgi:hypothetical protein